MRLFVAIELNDEARRAIGAEQNRLQTTLGDESRASLKWVRPEHMHLTLAFLGDLADDRGAIVADAMRGPLRGQPFVVIFGGLGVFPPRGEPRVLWLGLKTGAREVIAVHQRVADRLVRLGIALEQRAFHPHLTVARWRAARREERRRVLSGDDHRDVARIEIDAVTLVQSRLSSKGPTYRSLASARLGEFPDPRLQSD